MPGEALLSFLPDWPLAASPLALAALALLLAGLAGELVRRWLCLPRITGYALAGLLAGPSLLGWITPGELDGLRFAVDLALALLLFELGARVNLRWLRANPWLLAGSVAEASLAFAGVFAVVVLLGYSLPVALVVATVGISTSPAVVMRIAGELRARGQVTDRLLTLTALNVIYSVILIGPVLAYLHQTQGNHWAALLHPLYHLAGSLLVAGLLAGAFGRLRRHLDPGAEQSALLIFALLLLAISVLEALRLPMLLAPLLAGVLVKNADPRPQLWPPHFGPLGGVLVVLLFVLTGAALTLEQLFAGGIVALALIGVRVAGKLAGALACGPASGLSWRQSLALGAALCPMSGVAFVLTDDLRRLFPELGGELAGIVLSMIAILELLGPIVVQQCLIHIGEGSAEARENVHGA